MPSRTPRLLPSLCLLAIAVVSVSTASADEPSPSLYERRLGIIKGTSKGIVVYEPEKAAAPAGTTAGNGKVEVGTDGKPLPPAQQAATPSKFLSTLPPPSGRSMAEAQRLGAVGGGIPLPTARKAAPDAKADPAAKP